MKRALIAIAALGALTGCATQPQTFPVPVGCPAAQSAQRPSKPVSRLSSLDSSKPATVARAYASSVIDWRAYSQQLETLLDACK